MKALIVNGEELLRLSLREVAVVAARPRQILEAGSEHDFLALTANESHFDLIIIHPSTMACPEARAKGAEKQGHECLTLVRRLFPDCPTLVIENQANTDRNANNDTLAFLPRTARVAELILAIRKLLRLPADMPLARAGGIARPDVMAALRPANQTHEDDAEARIDLGRLSFRQKQILAMAADGLANKEIAARLNIAEGTVKAHMHAIFKVMGVSNRTQAVIRFGAAGPVRHQILAQVSA